MQVCNTLDKPQKDYKTAYYRTQKHKQKDPVKNLTNIIRFSKRLPIQKNIFILPKSSYPPPPPAGRGGRYITPTDNFPKFFLLLQLQLDI